MNRELLILRHAKSTWNTNAPSDFHRGLAPRGERAASLIGHWILDNDCIPQRVIASSAVRVIQTLDIVVRICAINAADISLNRDLYGTNVKKWVKCIKNTPDDISRVLICGHNPELEALSMTLCQSHIEPAENGKVMPTGTLIRLQATGPWQETETDSMHLLSVTRPRELQQA